MALGQVDYGLMGVVGGLTAFIAFFNGIMSGSIGRFYALTVGAQRINKDEGIESCRAWFTTAVLIHTVLPIVLMLIGYPIGEWAVRNFLTIPADRISDCVWVWRFVCISCFLGMVSVPYNAMYGAHQYIAELTIYSFVTTTLNACFLYYMVTHPGVWLVKFMFWQLLLGLLPNLIIAIRACYLFPECRFRVAYVRCWGRIKELCGYGLWTAWGTFGALLRAQGIAVLVNKYFGPKVNAGVAVGTGLSGHCNMLSGSMLGAFSPAIFNAWGAREYDKARSLAYKTCKFSVLFILIFAAPLALEVDEVLKLWLVHPPMYAAELCLFVIAMNLIDKSAVGCMICVNANGKVARYQAFLGTSLVLTLPLAWLLIEAGVGVYAVGWAMVATMCVCASGRVWFARSLVGMSAKYWVGHIALPLAMVIAITLIAGRLPQYFMAPSFVRIITTTVFAEGVLLPLSWFLVLNKEERSMVAAKAMQVIDKLRRRS